MRNVRTSAKDEGGRVTPPRAVAYVRMSTDHQKYSTKINLPSSADMRRRAHSKWFVLTRMPGRVD